MTGDDLRARLPRTWNAFFAVHGRFTETQERAMPAVLAGHDVLMVAPTSTGKTEAAIAPLLERSLRWPPSADGAGLRIVYLCPTRALVRDLFERLRQPLAELGIPLASKSGDTGPVDARRPPAVLVTTPESLDSLLTRSPRLLRTVRALVIDEIHLFDDSPRGDQLRCLLHRVERIRGYHLEAGRRAASAPPPRRPLQRIALSATVAEPRAVAERYLNDGVVVEAGAGRALAAELRPMASLHDLTAALNERSAAKTLVFCNTRNDVEQVAGYLRHHLGFEAAIFVHYANLDAGVRREVEAQFAAASVAICVSSSTLELGIDIGSIDDIALVGPPATPSSFLQRIGRGGRRGTVARVLCLPRSFREQLRFEALLAVAEGGAAQATATLEACGPQEACATEEAPAGYHFRPSVLVQQVFSLLKQSPTGGLRWADLRRVAPAEVGDDTLRRILDHLTNSAYLRSWRPAEWQSGELLGELADAHEIYANIGGESLGATIVDAYTGRKIARADRPRHQGETLLMGGRSVEVAWRDRFTFGIRQGRRTAPETMRFRTAPQAVPLDLAQGVAARLGLAPDELLWLPDGPGVWLFHFWGDVYGELLAVLLGAGPAAGASRAGTAAGAGPAGAGPADTAGPGAAGAVAPDGGTAGPGTPGAVQPAREDPPAAAQQPLVSAWNELCLLLPEPLEALPPWDARRAEAAAMELRTTLEPYLEMGRFQPLLPPDVALASVLEQIDLPRFEAHYRRASLAPAPAKLGDVLRALR